jgi:hypothetical protein
MMCNELDEKKKLPPEGDITHTRQHPDMLQSGRHGKQLNILVKDKENEKKSKMRSVKVTTKVDLKKGLPEQLSMKDLPSTSSSASSTPVAQKSRKKHRVFQARQGCHHQQVPSSENVVDKC